MGDAIEYNDVYMVLRGALNGGRLKLHKQGIVFKSQKTGKVEQITAADIENANWLRVARGFGVKLVLKDGTHYRFDGFKEGDFDKLSNFVKKNFETELGELELSVKGWNWGVAKFNGALMTFEVDKKPAFEIPLKDVSQATSGKNEVTVEFHQNDDAQVSLMEMRFFVPNSGDGDDQVKNFQEQVMSKADVIQATGDAIVSFEEIACLTPRGRYSIKVYPTFLQLHGKTYDYKIPHTTCLRLFLLPHKDQRFMFFVISMDPPIRQGQTRYPFLILQFERDQETSVNLNLSDKDIEEKYSGKLRKEMSGPLFEVVSRVLKEIIGRKITVPGTFKGHSGTSSINCSHKAGNGLLYPLERGFIFVHKPPVHIRFDEILCVNFARGSTTGRTFDFDVDLKNGTSVSFSNLERQDYGHLYDFVTSKNLRIRNKGGKSGGATVMDDLMVSDEESPDFYLEKVKAEAAEDDDDYERDDDEESDEDFNPDMAEEDVKEEFDSAASSSESEGSDDEEKPKKKKKEVKRKPEKREKEPAAKKPRKETKSGKKKKDPNAPKKPMSGYMIWLNENRENIKKEYPGISITDLSKKAGEKWKELGDKTEWDEKAKKAKEKYQKDLAAYNAQKKEDGGTPKKSKTISDSFSKKSPKPQKQSTSSPSKFKSKEFIESSEDDSSDDEGSKKKKTPSKSKEDDSEDEESEAEMTDDGSEGSDSD
ncbi:FACT complex subunit SSRP1-like isoform X1 [Rhopilema esculentum]|uniref:FACT complex subunit SSRP1-like isoform X1 n=1 Tax=Rhopilema esculentum TaxID=499914 RepID=UPI0031D1AFAE